MWPINLIKSKIKDKDTGIANFGIVSTNPILWRGALPDEKGYAALKKIGITDVINLISGDQSREEDRANDAGIYCWYHFPMKDNEKPDINTIKAIIALLKWNECFYISCKGGIHRTGVAIACWRVAACGWTKEQAWREARAFHYYRFPNHGIIEDWFLNEFNVKELL